MSDRVVRASILTSDAVCRLNWAAEVFYRRLMSVVDDFGRYDARISVLRASLYPLQLSNVSEPDIEKYVADCATAGLVRVYVVDSKRYIEIQKFNQRLRAKRSKWPSPVERPPPLASDSECQQALASADAFVSSTDSDSQRKREFEGKTTGSVDSVAKLLSSLGVQIYNQPENHWPGESAQRAAVMVIKRPAWQDEVQIILAFNRVIKPEDRRFQLPFDLTRLLENWPETLDKARNYKPHEKHRKHNSRNDGVAIGPTDYGEAAKRKLERQALEARNREAHEAQGNGA